MQILNSQMSRDTPWCGKDFYEYQKRKATQSKLQHWSTLLENQPSTALEYIHLVLSS
jgi:hypothetical protein